MQNEQVLLPSTCGISLPKINSVVRATSFHENEASIKRFSADAVDPFGWLGTRENRIEPQLSFPLKCSHSRNEQCGYRKMQNQRRYHSIPSQTDRLKEISPVALCKMSRCYCPSHAVSHYPKLFHGACYIVP